MLNLFKNHIYHIYTIFFLRILLVKVVFLKSPFSNLTFQSRFSIRMWFLSRFRLNLLKKHVPFENSAREGGFLKSLSQITIFKSNFSEPISKKECGLGVDLGLISSKTMFLLRILLVKVVFSNHFLKSPFSNLTFRVQIYRFPKRMWFLSILSRFRLKCLISSRNLPYSFW